MDTFYTVTETFEITSKYINGKRYPSEYSVFHVMNGDKVVDSFSALEHGLEDAEYMANELRVKLNNALPKTTVPTVENPAPDSVIIYSDGAGKIWTLDSSGEREEIAIEKMYEENKSLRKQLTAANARIENHAAYMDKLEKDAIAYQAIILKAGEDFAALKQLTGYIYQCDYCHVPMNESRRVADTAGGDSQVCEKCYPFADEPAQVVTHVTTTLMVHDIVLHKSSKGAQMVVNQIVGDKCLVMYRHSKGNELKEFLIEDLELEYRPSWNRTAIAKKNEETTCPTCGNSHITESSKPWCVDCYGGRL